MGKDLIQFEDRAGFVVPGKDTRIDVRIGSESVWLTPAQMSDLFGRELSVIHRHIRNAFSEGEVPDEEGYRQNLPITSKAGGRPEVAYNLDVVISVGYRVKSSNGVAFRRWATGIIKEKLLSDYRRGARDTSTLLAGVKNISILAKSIDADDPESNLRLLDLIDRYARSWQVLLQYDEKRLPEPSGELSKKMARLTLRQAQKAIEQFRKSLIKKGEATEIFGRDRGDLLGALLGNLEQTWGGQPVYPNIDTRAAHLLYFVIKNHPFVDGNKRIGSLLFLHYLEKNKRPLLEDSALVALALLVAESDPKQKEFVIRLIVSLMQELIPPEAPAGAGQSGNGGAAAR